MVLFRSLNIRLTGISYKENSLPPLPWVFLHYATFCSLSLANRKLFHENIFIALPIVHPPEQFSTFPRRLSRISRHAWRSHSLTSDPETHAPLHPSLAAPAVARVVILDVR